MNLHLERLKKEEIDLFNKEDERAFNVHARYFPDGIVPGAAEDDRDEYELTEIFNHPKYTVLSIKDGTKFIGGAIVEDMGHHISEIAVFFLIVEYQSRGIGKQVLDMVEAYFPNTKVFHLITPSQVVRNTVFYVNKCGYRIVEVTDFDRDRNTADFVFEKENPFYSEATMKNTKVTLAPLEADDREQFILDNQVSFKYGAVEEFGLRDDHFEEDGEIISRATIEQSIDAPDSEAYRILYEGRKVGGVVLKIDKETHHNELELLFVSPKEHSKGIGYGAWLAVEALHPETEVWETCTPYFEKRNIHFYINKCGFHAVEFFSAMHPEPNPPEKDESSFPDDGPDEMFRFEKVMK